MRLVATMMVLGLLPGHELRATSARIVHPELAHIHEVHLRVLVSPRTTWPDPVADTAEAALTKELESLLVDGGFKPVQGFSPDGKAPIVDVTVTSAPSPSNTSSVACHVALKLREHVVLERLHGVSASQRGVTWEWESLEITDAAVVSSNATAKSREALASLIDDIEYATRFSPDRSRGTRSHNNEMQRTRPAQATEPRR